MIIHKELMAKTNSALFIFIIFLLTVSANVSAGIFDYDTKKECMNKLPGKLMTRWMNPLPKSQAMQAAREFCKSYPNDYEFKLRSMSDSELVEERKDAVAEDAEIRRNMRRNKIRRDKFGYDPNMPIEFRMLRTKYVDAEIKRRK